MFTIFVAVVGFATDVLGETVRWDLVLVVQDTAIAGGANVATDLNVMDTITMTGSGQANPEVADATGGGLFTHRRADGSEVAHGVYVVTNFIGWSAAGGTRLAPDGIGHADEARAGELRMGVRLFPEGASPSDGVFTVHCALPGAAYEIWEGVSLIIGPVVFQQPTPPDPPQGVTLFHVHP
jgi:hypothetical protein